jgi:uncharacterized protein (TIGR02145 family)
MRLVLLVILIVCIGIHTLISCSSDGYDEPSPSSSSRTKPPSSSSSSIDCSIISSSSVGEDLCADFDPNAEIEHHGKMKKQICDERDGKKYVYTQIDEQIWMAENLNYDICGSKCSGADTNTETCDKYGRLYNWPMALTICPDGWHLPSYEEWMALIDYAGGEATAGTKLKAAKGDWLCIESTVLKKQADYLVMEDCICCSSGTYRKGTDDYGFSALPGSGTNGDWWSDNTYEYNSSTAYELLIDYSSTEIFGYILLSDIRMLNAWKTSFLSVRCIKD